MAFDSPKPWKKYTTPAENIIEEDLREIEAEKEKQMKGKKQLILVEWLGVSKKSPNQVHKTEVIDRKELQEFVLKLYREGVEPDTMHYWEKQRDIILEVKPKDDGPVMR